MSDPAPELDSTDDPPAGGPRPWLLLACVVVVVAACYAPVLGAPFIWDDQHLIDSPLVKELRPLGQYFAGSFWQHDEVGVLRTYYRPLVILSLALDHRVFGDNPGGFHVTNLLVHLLTTSVLFRLLRRDGATGAVAAAGSALWGLYPRLTEAAAWIAGRTDALAGFFVLSALLVHRSTGRLARYVCAALLLLGLLCKETALAGALAVLLSEARAPGSVGVRLRRASPVLLGLGCYASFRVHAIGLLSNALTLPVAKRAPAVAEAIGRYAWMLLTPWLPDAQIGRMRVRSPGFVAFGCVLCVLTAFWAYRRRARWTGATFEYVVLGGAALSLALYAIPFSVSAIAADRFLYLPLAGLTLAVAPTLTRWGARRRGLALVAVLALGASFGAATFFRAAAWADEIEFWSATFRRHPEEPSMSAVALGRLFSREGSFDKALTLFKLASEPGMDCEELARNNTGTVLLATGQYAEAAHVLSQLAVQHPNTTSTFVNLALAESYLGRFKTARAALDRTLELAPKDAGARQLRDRLPELAAMRRELDASGEAMPVLLRARLESNLGLSHEALESYRSLLAAPDVTPRLAEEAVWLALRKGDVATQEALVARYAAVAGASADARLQLAYAIHLETLTKLDSAWTTLGTTSAPGR